VSPPVTVVTATWKRPRTLFERAIPSVAAQDYDGWIEHLIVTDGFDADLNVALSRAGYAFESHRRRVVHLGRNWSAPEVVHGGVGVVPRQVGAWMARGDYIAYLDDDNEYLPHHVSTLVTALRESGADFACSRWQDPEGRAAGWAPPGRGRTDTSSVMHRAAVLRHGTWDPAAGYESDGALVERWIAAGASWAFVPVPTFVLHPHRLGAPDPEPEAAAHG
jgi:O-antigen biosynthesis protein